MKKIYLENIKLNNDNIENIIENLNIVAQYNKSFIEDYIYSGSGIYMINHNSIYKLERTDIAIERLKLNNKALLIDKSSDLIEKKYISNSISTYNM